MKNKLAKIAVRGDKELYLSCPVGFVDSNTDSVISSQYGSDTSTIYDGDSYLYNDVHFNIIKINDVTYKYIPWGVDNLLPYKIKQLIEENMVTAQSMLYNIKACYGQGVRYFDKGTEKETNDPDIIRFRDRNDLHAMFMEQCTDMKYYYLAFTVIYLCRDMSKIVKVRHREACYMRFEAPDETGKIGHVFYANWPQNVLNTAEVIELLDPIDPLSDLMVRLGKEPDPFTGITKRTTDATKFCIVSRMPTPGYQFYPIPYYTSIFRDNWMDIYRLIGIGKRYKIKNNGAPRFQVEVHQDYWQNLCDEEGIMDPLKRLERIKKEKQDINDYITGIENSGRTWITGYYIDPNGKENRMVRVININEKKEGGDWSDDIQEASNALCFGTGTHPNLIGATPGKSQMNNSGSDKRELFTLKQAMEKSDHDILLKPYRLILEYNGWSDKVDVDVPMVQLTTLDQNKDSQVVKVGQNENNDNQNNQEDGNSNQ